MQNWFGLDLDTPSLKDVILKRKEQQIVFYKRILKSLENHNFSSNRSKTLGLASFNRFFLVLFSYKISAQSAERFLRNLILRKIIQKYFKIWLNFIQFQHVQYILAKISIFWFERFFWGTLFKNKFTTTFPQFVL